jgi:hypothetical protein
MRCVRERDSNASYVRRLEQERRFVVARATGRSERRRLVVARAIIAKDGGSENMARAIIAKDGGLKIWPGPPLIHSPPQSCLEKRPISRVVLYGGVFLTAMADPDAGC